MAIRNRWRPGSHLVWCDRCGTTYYNDQIKKEWTGLLVCDGPGTRQCYEERNPIDFTRGHREDFTVPEARPRNIDRGVIAAASFIVPGYVDDGYWNYEFTE